MIVLKDCYCVYDGNQRLYNKNVIIRDNIIHAITDPSDTSYMSIEPLPEIIDCSTHIVIPGLINTHHHFYQILTRNLPAVQNVELFDWLLYLYNIWQNITPQAVLYSSMAAVGELMKTGCTCSTDHHYLYPENFNEDIMSIQFEAADQLGIRFSPTRGSMSRSRKDGGLPPDSVVQTEDAIIDDSERVIKEFHDSSPLSMRRIILAPCSPFSITSDLMKETAALARLKGVRLHTHLAETRDENESCRKLYGCRPLELMAKCDFTGPDVFFAHGIHFNDDELKTLAETGCGISHCPSSNMRLGSGIARISEMIKLGINVSLAVDGSASNDSSDMLGEIRNAMLLQRVLGGAAAMTVEQAFSIATAGGAAVLGFEKCGKIASGMAADLAVFNLESLGYAGALSDPLAALIFCGYNHQTEYTIVNGKITVREGVLTGFDEEFLTVEVNRIASELVKGI
ncbi:MAG: 8-oxoguanine deaminase [Spirochaetales bacterium]|uniref:8-oxoguanine deaminase n=1 Tax=Candidatus Thalassospirochaeta sargassi TaxID=3119039 RepID=A0AAJ1MKS4_9SPIO|nr:8-oxoguanine deaminase [Spirochaetales bacterium]